MKCVISLICLLVWRSVESQDPFELASEIQGGDIVGFNSDLEDFRNFALAAVTFITAMKNPYAIRRNHHAAAAAIVIETKLVYTLIRTLEINRKPLEMVSGRTRSRISRICRFGRKLLKRNINILTYINTKVTRIHSNVVSMAALATNEVNHYVSDTLFCFEESKFKKNVTDLVTKNVARIYEYADQLSRSTNENMEVKLNELSKSEEVLTEDIHFLLDRANYIKDTMEQLTRLETQA